MLLNDTFLNNVYNTAIQYLNYTYNNYTSSAYFGRQFYETHLYSKSHKEKMFCFTVSNIKSNYEIYYLTKFIVIKQDCNIYIIFNDTLINDNNSKIDFDKTIGIIKKFENGTYKCMYLNFFQLRDTFSYGGTDWVICNVRMLNIY